MNQALRGYPLDVNYFWTELSPLGMFGADLYNGNGGANWKIGQPKATAWNAQQLRSLPELQKFAVELVNRDRTLNNLKPLVTDPLLSQAAQRYAQDMMDRNYFSHISPEGKNPRDRYLAVGGSHHVGVGENIYKGTFSDLGLNYKQVENFQRGWMYSNGHRANILTPKYGKFGYGIAARPNGEIYAVQMFSN
ncbi:CAP domain-containing protein [Sphaerospermopsis aphanizomenoides]|uniref:CAP domain-containing protein n=1 Tax=Sphaerospermopsis aphanizomenoides TaxID=459663 RepID=UPI001F39B17B|nr:CAP domain-containing protein [Sphaerospermopsis aphanizomenoides]